MPLKTRPDDEDGEPEANATKMIGLRHEYEQSR
jgi:hypothetical protein